MVYQRTKFNLIILVSLCIFGIMRIESVDHVLPMTVDDSGVGTVNFFGLNFTLRENLTVTLQGYKCTWTVDLSQPDQDELTVKRGSRKGDLWCKHWDNNNTMSHTNKVE
uniref:Uncharacterized protein n=1 Tax=Trichobilharzia regenti TaxID=157069 RepID=A0AA85KCE7_TRIRE|nr:unnamed protein product [Trichobilharzia regenti]